MPKKSPGINGGSMSDISFLLLTFFLLTSSINTDSGIARRLPPILPPDAPKPEVHDRNAFKVLVSFKDELRVQDENIDISLLREMVKEFFANPTNDPNLSEKEPKDIPLLGSVPVTKGVISLKNDRGTSYEMYIRVQNELAAAIHELRDEYAIAEFGVKFDDLRRDDQRRAIQRLAPMSISEAEPTSVNVGGNK